MASDEDHLSQADRKTDRSVVATTINRLHDEAMIRQLGEVYDAAWNQGDVHALGSVFTPGVVVVSPRGEVITGRTAFIQTLSNLFRGSFKGSTHETTVFRFHFLKEDVAVVDGEATLTLLNSRDGNNPLTHHYTDVMIKADNRWLIADTRAYVFMED